MRPKDGAVVLRVWQDKKRKLNGKWHMELTNHKAYAGNDGDLGYAERLEHVRLVRSGAPVLMVMCEAVDIHAQPRDIKDFNRREVFYGGALVEDDGDWWLEMASRGPIEGARA